MNSKYFSTMNASLSILSMWMMWVTLTKEKTTMMEWSMMKFMSSSMKMSLMMDKKSTAFAACVLIITAAVMTYSNYYMMESKKKNSFKKMIVAFITSMMMLIFSSNTISLVMGWEGLGLVSFVLIMFYQNKKSLNSSFYTMVMNRVGDIALILGMTNMMSMSSWTLTLSMFQQQNLMMMFMMTAAFSKSAQLPFSSWLTEAMAAPTPISALVHSSTLVTAGVFMFIRFEMTMKYKKITKMIFLVSMMTLIMASMNSTTEWDMKKIIALSTLSQISMMFITISLNMFSLAMFHLLVHATFKALIFLCSSSFISFANTQDMRKMNKLSKNMLMTKMSFNIATLTLCGFPFMSSLYSKEMIMEMMLVKKMNSMFVILFYMCMAATLFYSIKSIMFINQAKHTKKMTPKQEGYQQKVSKITLLVPSVVYGNKMNWMMNINFKIPLTTKMEKMIPIISMMLMVMLIKEVGHPNTKMETSKKKMMVNYMWFMKNMSTPLKKMTLSKFFVTFKNTEKTVFNKMIKMSIESSKALTSTNFKIIHTKQKKINMILLMTAIMMT